MSEETVPYTPPNRQTAGERLAMIEQWLQAESDEGDGSGFWLEQDIHAQVKVLEPKPGQVVLAYLPEHMRPEEIEAVITQLRPWFAEHYPDVRPLFLQGNM